jgi:hypothetical protein
MSTHFTTNESNNESFLDDEYKYNQNINSKMMQNKMNNFNTGNIYFNSKIMQLLQDTSIQFQMKLNSLVILAIQVKILLIYVAPSNFAFQPQPTNSAYNNFNKARAMSFNFQNEYNLYLKLK